MPTKTREYYLTTSSNRDFAWFFFRIPPPRPARSRPDPPPPPHRVPKMYRAIMPPITEEPGQALMAPTDVKARTQVVKAKPEPTRQKKSKPKQGGSKNAGPWSDWYVGEDGSYFWRARQFQNKSWDYQFTPGYQEPPQVQDTTPTTSSSELSRPLSPSPASPPGSPNPSPSLNSTSPKSSWPTIITTSTGQPTDDLSASSSQTLVSLPKEGDGMNQLGAASMALVPSAVSTKASPTRANNKRPVGPVMRLLQEGRSRRNKATVTQATKSTTAANTTTTAPGRGGLSDGDGGVADKPQQHPSQAMTTGQGNNGSGGGGGGGGGRRGIFLVKNRSTSALAKKLHARVKSEKELKVDPKRRVRAWLKGVEVDFTPIPLDAMGFPIYR